MLKAASITIAILDRNPLQLTHLASYLEDYGYRVLSASTQGHLERFLSSQTVNLVVKSFDASKVDPIPFLKKIRTLSPDISCILCGKNGNIANAVQSIKEGASDYIPHPVNSTSLHKSIKKSLKAQSLSTTHPVLRQSLKRKKTAGFFIPNSPTMNSIYDDVARVSEAEISTLITGESGTGKELVAQTIHQKSLRKNGPFIAVNCAGLTDTLIESELFGHVRGAFTGAISTRPGAFEAAAHGTLFLDEIGDLSVKGQGDLLRVLEDGYYHPVGSTQPKRADVRIIAATHRNLYEMTFTNQFRKDLYYRLNVVELKIPPLRERKQDIPLMVESFIELFCQRHKKAKKKASKGFLSALCAHNWPGNVRELRNLIERLVVTVPGDIFKEEHAPINTKAIDHSSINKDGSVVIQVGTPLIEVEKIMIEATLRQVNGNRSEAARKLGISRRSLHYKIKEESHPKG